MNSMNKILRNVIKKFQGGWQETVMISALYQSLQMFSL